MSYTPTAAVRFCAAIAVIASFGLSVSHAGPPVRPAYALRVLPIEFPYVADFNDRRQVIGYGPRDLATLGFVWDARRGLELISPLGAFSETSAFAIPFDINSHGRWWGSEP